MLFKDVKMRNKREFFKETRNEIFDGLKGLLDMDGLSNLVICNYIEDLLLESEFDRSNKSFTYPITHHRITVEDFVSIAHSYIVDHAEDFR